MGDESKLEVQVRLNENNEPEFKNLLSLASSGRKPLSCDTVEEEVERDPPTFRQDENKVINV